MISSAVPVPLVRDFKLSGFNPSTGMTSFAKVSHDPVVFPRLFMEIGRTSLATFSSSAQHDFEQESFVCAFEILFSMKSVGTAIFVRRAVDGCFGADTNGFWVTGLALTGAFVALGVVGTFFGVVGVVGRCVGFGVV